MVRIAVVGAGRWGTHWTRIGLEHPEFQLGAVVDPIAASLDRMTERYGSRPHWQDVKLCPSLAEAIAAQPDNQPLEAVIVATPAVDHVETVSFALHQGLHVLVEKPVTMTVADGEKLAAIAQAQQKILCIDHTYLFNGAVAAGKEFIGAGNLQTLRYGYATRTHFAPVRQDVDVLWDLVIHDICIFNHWLDDFPTAVAARGMIWLQPGESDQPAATHDYPMPANGLADQTWLILRYRSGVEITIHLCWSNPDKQRRLVLVGDSGALVFDDLRADQPLTFLGSEWKQGDRNQGQPLFLPEVDEPQSVAIEEVEPLQAVADCFVEAITTGKIDPRSSAETGVGLVKVLAAASRSLSKGGVWESVK
ncbi:MAG: Gfo/Idh/MocA family oxidoreductase [Cyanobacteria bacterium P01_C01_bin.89]